MRAFFRSSILCLVAASLLSLARATDEVPAKLADVTAGKKYPYVVPPNVLKDYVESVSFGATLTGLTTWAAGTDYAQGVYVSHTGSSWYAATDPTTGEEPGVASDWIVVAEKGDPGAAGADGSAVPLAAADEYNAAEAVSAADPRILQSNTGSNRNVATLAGTFTTSADPNAAAGKSVQVLNPNGATRNVVLASPGSTGVQRFSFINSGTTSSDVLNFTDPTPDVTVGAGFGGLATWNGTGWVVATDDTPTLSTNSITSRTGQPLALASLDSNANITLTPHGTGQIRLAPTSGGVRLPSTATGGLQIYNTADETTNYERLEMLFSTNVATIRTARGGAGTARTLQIGSTAVNQYFRTSGSSSGWFQFDASSTNLAGAVGYNFSAYTNTATSGTSIGLSLTPTYNQTSGTAANTDLLINRTETAVGSGAQVFIDCQVGGSSRFQVMNDGRVLAKNLRINHSTLTYAASTAIDFTGDGFQTCSLTGNITFTTSNLAAGRSKTVRIVSDGSSRTFTFPSWVFVGAAAPASIAANKTAILTLTSFGTTDADVVAAYSVQP